MATTTFKKYSNDAAVKTVGEVDATLVDVILPHTELVGAMANTVRSGIYGLAGWTLRGVKEGKGWNPLA